MKSVLFAIALLCAAAPAAAAEPQLSAHFGRATGKKDVDIVRLAYRHPPAAHGRWWWVQHISNAGIKQPNGGIDFILLTATFAL